MNLEQLAPVALDTYHNKGGKFCMDRDELKGALNLVYNKGGKFCKIIDNVLW